MTGSCFGSPRFSASLPSQAASSAFGALSPGYPRPPPLGAAAAASATSATPAEGGGAAGAAGDADELDVRHVHVARDLHDLVLVVALQGGELAAVDVARQEADVPVGPE